MIGFSIEEIKDVLKNNPDNPGALRARGQNYLEKGDFKSAREYYLQAIKLCPHLLADIILDYEAEIVKEQKGVGPVLSLAGLYFNVGEVDSALLELEEALEQDPACKEAYNVLGKICIKQERIDEAIALMERSLANGIRDVALAEMLAGAYVEKGRLADAVKFYEEVLKSRPAEKQILRILGELYSRMRDYHKAAKCYEEMFSEDPEVSREVIQRLEDLLIKSEGSISLREILVDIYIRSLRPEAAIKKLKEIVGLDRSKLEDAIAKLKSILKSYPQHPEATEALAETLCLRGSFTEAAECYRALAKAHPQMQDRVIAGYHAILEQCPEQVLVRDCLAEAYLDKQQVDEALKELMNMVQIDKTAADLVVQKCVEIIKLKPDLVLAHLVLGQGLLAKGEALPAIREAEEIMVRDKKYVPAYVLLGEANLILNNLRKASSALTTALALEPYASNIQEKYRAVKERELKEEIALTLKKLAADPWKVSLHTDLAKLYMQADKDEDAIRELQIAQKEPARAPFALNLLGTIYCKEGKFDLAAAQFHRVLACAPSDISGFSQTVCFNLGLASEALGNPQKALKIYESILQEDIDFGNLQKKVKYLKGASLESMRNKTLLVAISQIEKREIIAFWGRTLKAGRGGGRREALDVSFGQKHNLSGFDFFMQGMYKAAEEEFQLAVELDRQFPAALNNLAVALLREGKVEAAKSYLEEAADLCPGSAVLRNNLGVLYLFLGQIALAKEELGKAAELDPELSAICLNLGDICFLGEEISSAIKYYQRVGKYDVLSALADRRLMYKTPM